MSTVTLLQILVFSLGTILIIVISRKSLRNFKIHGFYRFFVFEAALALIVLNMPFWFREPFSFQQILSWIILFLSLYPLFQSVTLLKKFGGSKERKIDSANYNFENTAILVKEGIYKCIRHPMYSSLLLLCIGALLKNITVVTVLLGLIAIIFLILTAKVEEKENITFFGNAYLEYMKETKMFIPYVF
jgi:protein-S-isoprenylcysteine O-methyltransferase Ste14